MNNRIRFVAITAIMFGLFPFTLLFWFIGWLIGEGNGLWRDYVRFYRETWR